MTSCASRRYQKLNYAQGTKKQVYYAIQQGLTMAWTVVQVFHLKASWHSMMQV